jgi:phosphoribosylformylglycinamidine synthase I
MKNSGVLRFPGTNCDRDVFQALERRKPKWLWYEDQFDYREFDALYIPGGFSFGDYLRSGALAARSPVMKSVREAAFAGVPILGICNCFQILCEAQLLPGVLLKNEGLRFRDAWVDLSLKNPSSHFASSAKAQQKFNLPIAHGDGRYFLDEEGLKKIQDQNQIWFTYDNNPNGSLHDIAGVMNENRNVMALMPHPERAVFEWMGSQDGTEFFI